MFSWTNYPTQSQTFWQACNRLEGNIVYRGSCSSGGQCTSVQRCLDPTTGNEEYVLIPDGNIVSLAT